jgi:hypothetical protein
VWCETQVISEAGLGRGHAVVGFEINLLVLDALPKPLDEDIIAPAAFAIHADLDLVFLTPSRRNWRTICRLKLKPGRSGTIIALLSSRLSA